MTDDAAIRKTISLLLDAVIAASNAGVDEREAVFGWLISEIDRADIVPLDRTGEVDLSSLISGVLNLLWITVADLAGANYCEIDEVVAELREQLTDPGPLPADD